MVPPASILTDSSNASSTKQKLTLLLVLSIRNLADYNLRSSIFNPKSDEEQYTSGSSPDDQFATDNKSDNGDNNAVATIEKLFLDIRYWSFYKSLTEKTI